MNPGQALVAVGPLKEQGLAAFRAGDFQSAEEAFDHVLEAHTQAGDEAGQAEMLVNLGVVHMQTRRFEQSEKELTRAGAIFQRLGRRSEEAQSLGNLGTLYERAGKPKQAADHYQRAVTIFGELGEKENQQATLGALTRLQVGQRNFLQSLFTYEQALAAGQKLTLKQRFFRWLFRIVRRLMRW